MNEPHSVGGTAPVAILCAMPEERRLLVDALERRVELDGRPITADAGVLDGIDVVIAEAGIGKTNAASAATAIVERHAPAALVLSGVAGGVREDLDVGDIVVARRVVDTDYGRETGRTRIAYQPGTLPIPSVTPDAGYDMPPELVRSVEAALHDIDADAPTDAPSRVIFGTIASGDVFVSSTRYRDELANRWSADAVEMEGAAICGVAERYDLPWLIVRALSDRAGEDSVIDYEKFVALAAARSAGVLRYLLPLVSAIARP
jgi:adenosylhomocysteine nucleosidase